MAKFKNTLMVILSMIWISCVQFTVVLVMFTHRQSGLTFLGRTWVWGKAIGCFLFFVAGFALLGLALICWRSRRGIAYVPAVVAASLVLALIMAGVYDHLLDRTAIGTIQSSIETDLTQRDLAIYGELGLYGGLLKQPESGERAYYVCSAMNNYGPFSYQPFATDVSLGEEVFVETTPGELRSVTERKYADGYWVCVKRFRSAEDMSIDVQHLDDLRDFIRQARFENHRGATTDVAQIFQALELELGDLAQ